MDKCDPIKKTNKKPSVQKAPFTKFKKEKMKSEGNVCNDVNDKGLLSRTYKQPIQISSSKRFSST